MSGGAVVLDRVNKAYGTTLVFEGLGARFELGTTHILMGPSGAGKTTLIRLVLGLEDPDAGRIEGCGGLRKGAVFQEDRLCENLSVAANLCLVWDGERRGERRERWDRARRLLDRIGLQGTLDRPVCELSGGMKRRVAIVRAVLAPSDLLAFDEPLKGLDAQTKRRLMEAIGPLVAGKTLFWVTHDEGDRDYFERCRLYRVEGPPLRGALPLAEG